MVVMWYLGANLFLLLLRYQLHTRVKQAFSGAYKLNDISTSATNKLQ